MQGGGPPSSLQPPSRLPSPLLSKPSPSARHNIHTSPQTCGVVITNNPKECELLSTLPVLRNQWTCCQKAPFKMWTVIEQINAVYGNTHVCPSHSSAKQDGYFPCGRKSELTRWRAPFVEETEGPASEMNEQVSIQRGISTQSHYWEKPLYESPALGTWEAISSLPNEHDPIGDKNIHMSHWTDN